MNYLFVFFVIVAVVRGQELDEWEAYKEENKKNYDYNEEVNNIRAGVFTREDWEIRRHNSKHNSTYERGHSEFSDLTALEKAASLLGSQTPESIDRDMLEMTAPLEVDERQIPTLLDYRSDPCMPQVKRQGKCGACWAFTAITPLEFSACKKSKGTFPVPFSEQQLIDCNDANKGCSGEGWFYNAWTYLRKSGGIAKAAGYSYTEKQGEKCQYTANMFAAKVVSMAYVTTKNVRAMQTALMKFGPLGASMAVVNSLYSYRSGIYNDVACDGLGVNHGVVIVGYGTLDGLNYWVVRNSWGRSWGDKGYMLIERGVNKCNIEVYPAYVIAGV